jgi:hypothetical protein
MPTKLKSLAALAKILERPEDIRLLVASSLAEEALNLTKDTFRSETDPYGDKWAPKQRPDGRKVLSGRTSRLKNGWHRKLVSAEQVIIAPSVDYAAPHQNPQRGPSGQLKRPRRMMVPSGELGLPPKWSKQLQEASNDAFAAIFGADGRRVSALRNVLGVDALVGFKVG